MSKTPNQLLTNSNINQTIQMNSIIEKEEESIITKLTNFKNSCPLIIKSIIIFNIINLFINLLFHIKGFFFLIIRTFFIIFFWSPLGKQIEITSGSGRYLLLFFINNFIIFIPYIPLFNNFYFLSEINYNFALFETILVALSNKDKYIVVINNKIPFKFIIYVVPFISLILVYKTFAIIFTVGYSFLYHKYLINKLSLNDEIIKKFETLFFIKYIMKNKSYIKIFDEYIPIVENNIQENDNIYDNNFPNMKNQQIVFENINENIIYNYQNDQCYNNITMSQCFNNEQINQNNENKLNIDNKNEVININECIICDNKKENVDKKNNLPISEDKKNMNIDRKNEEKPESINLKNEQNNMENKKEETFEYFNLKNKPNEPKLDSNNEEIFEYFNLKNKPNEPKLDSNNEEIFEYFNLKNKPNEPKLDSNNEEIFEYFNLKNKPNEPKYTYKNNENMPIYKYSK